MIIDKEDHREILRMAVQGIPISGPAGDPDMLRHVLAVHEVLAAIDSATVKIDASLEAYVDR